MAISFVNSASTTQPQAGTIVVNKPTGVAQNDVLYAMVYCAGGNNAATAPAGWTRLKDQIDGPGNITSIFRLVAGAGEPSTYTFSETVANDALNAAISAYRGVNTTTPEDATTTSQNGSGASVNAPTITTVTDQAWHVVFYETDGNATTLTIPTGYASPADVPTFGSSGDVSMATHKQISPPGATGTVTSTQNDTGGWMAFSIALRPAVTAVFPSFARGVARQRLVIRRSVALVAPQTPTFAAITATAIQKRKVKNPRLFPLATVAPLTRTVIATANQAIQKRKVKAPPPVARVAPQTLTVAATAIIGRQERVLKPLKEYKTLVAPVGVAANPVATIPQKALQKPPLRVRRSVASVALQTPTVPSTSNVALRKRPQFIVQRKRPLATAPPVVPDLTPTTARRASQKRKVLAPAPKALVTPIVLGLVATSTAALQKRPLKAPKPRAAGVAPQTFGVPPTTPRVAVQKRKLKLPPPARAILITVAPAVTATSAVAKQKRKVKPQQPGAPKATMQPFFPLATAHLPPPIGIPVGEVTGSPSAHPPPIGIPAGEVSPS